jgi:hypothetical protein
VKIVEEQELDCEASEDEEIDEVSQPILPDEPKPGIGN